MISLVTLVLYLLPPLLAAVYTVQYGRWTGRQGNARGAWGLYVLALLTFLVPLLVLTLRGSE